MNNLGKASVTIEILNTLPGIDKVVTQYNFEVSAYNYDSIINSAYFIPLLVEQIKDEAETFAVCYPSKRKAYIDNYIENKDGSAAPVNNLFPYITFKAVDTQQGVVKDIIIDGKFDSYPLLQPGDYENGDTNYIGPEWANSPQSGLSIPNDALTLKLFDKYVKDIGVSSTTDTTTTSTNGGQQTINLTQAIMYVNQQRVRDGLWWEVESSDFLKENMPFWVNLRVAAPPSVKHETVFVISLGLGNNDEAYDILISLNNKPRIIDYYAGRTGDYSQVPYNQKEFDLDLSRVLDSQQCINVGVMTVAGRLVVFINEIPLIYTRIDKSSGDSGGTIKEAKISAGKIRVFGTNVQSIINVCPMTFAPRAAMALPIPSIATKKGQTSISYKGVTNTGTYEGPVCLLPQQPDKPGKFYGVDCLEFSGDGGSASPDGTGFHKQGKIVFQSATNAGITSMPDSDYHVLIMTPGAVTWGDGYSLENGGAPYFFRLKGGNEETPAPGGGGGVTIPDVISATQTVSAPDYYHVMSTATIEIYNKNGQYDYLRKKQHGIRMSWAWQGEFSPITDPTFVGVIVGANSNEVAGKETMTLQCEDFMRILKDTPIINSPFYDGMVAYYAIADLAKRAGVTEFIKDWESENDYFLSSGYVYSQPKVRFEQSQKIFECIISLVQRFQAFIYFDAQGKLHINNLPGGLFSVTEGTVPSANFVRDPLADTSTVILDQKNIDYDFSSTQNRMTVMTVDRDTRNAIFYTRSATGAEDTLAYRKVNFLKKPELGDIESARMWVERAIKRVFYPIRKTSFVTTGSGFSLSSVLDFITVDGQEYRLMSITRKYSAHDNSFTNEYGAEWLGGN